MLSRTLLAAVVLTFTTSSQGLLTTASKDSTGRYAYNFATIPFLAECLKLCISTFLLSRQHHGVSDRPRYSLSWKGTSLFLPPSVLYWFHNNVQFLTLKYLDTATYQILGNLKILTTGLLFWACLGRRLTPLQWISLLLLAIGITTSQVSVSSAAQFIAPLQGYLWSIASAFVSALAAIYTEWVMKRNSDSLYWQNMQLYSFGIVLNGMGLIIGDIRSIAGHSSLWPRHLFRGYNGVTFLLVANLAFSGLLVSWIMKYADSIVKVFATSMAMLVTTLVSVAAFGLQPSLQMILGMTTASISLILYYMGPSLVKLPDSPLKLPK
ncbi:hypothetical protein WJX74_007893 [Apatococcus lobatus]|uniref:Uncharacterized protein n=1 Tax=Apatococcus lobatus TaxID=904363 RepID=A0AAW1RFY9_9CHLO